MDAQEHLRAGRVDEALSALQAEVRSHPADAKKRTFLFQLLAVMGRWDRALDQLSVAGELDPSTLAMVHTYRPALASEKHRAEIFAGKRQPVVFGEPERWIALLSEALRQDAAGKNQAAQATRDQAFEEAQATTGRINGQPFEWIADCDPRLGPVLEVVTGGNFYWIPFHRIQRIAIEAPEDLRDLIWMPAHFTWANGGEGVGLIPVRYAGTENAEDNALRLSRKTDWIDTPGGGLQGVGQRMIATDGGEFPMLEVREVDLDTAQS